MNQLDRNTVTASDGARVVPIREDGAREGGTPALVREFEAASWAVGAQIDVLKDALGLAREPDGNVSTEHLPTALLALGLAAIEDCGLAVAVVLASIDPQRSRDAQTIGDLMRQHAKALYDEPTSSPSPEHCSRQPASEGHA